MTGRARESEIESKVARCTVQQCGPSHHIVLTAGPFRPDTVLFPLCSCHAALPPPCFLASRSFVLARHSLSQLTHWHLRVPLFDLDTSPWTEPPLLLSLRQQQL